MEEGKFKPYVPADKVMPEFTVLSVILGSILAIVFGGANAYLGLRVGMTVSASIPAAVLSMGIIRFILKRDSILENNMVQTIGSAGESVAAGAIFTLPALFMWADEGLCSVPSLLEIGLIALCGGILGVLFMVPLRSALIVKEHGVLAYPEGQACAEVLIAGEEGGAKASTVFAGLGIAAAYKFVADGLKLFPSEVAYEIPAYKGSGIGADVLPALAGVGYICGVKVSSYLFAGGITAWFILMPLIALFGGDAILFPADVTVNTLLAGGVDAMWSKFIRYIGAGAVLAGGIMSLISSLPLILRTFKDAIGVYGKNEGSLLRTEQDLSMKFLLIGIFIIALALWLIPTIPLNFFSAMIVILFGFFFSTVSSRMVGLIGSSNNPVSGMAIATLLISTLLLKATGNTGIDGMIAAIIIGGIICVIAAIAGDTSQDLKTGFLVGATPKKQQIGEIIGCIVSAIAIGGIMYLLSAAWSYGSTPFAIGLYLPIYLSTPIMAGGLLRWFLEKRKYKSEKAKENCVQSGVLYTSGLIAGEGIVGILLAVFAVIGLDVDISGTISLGRIGGLVFFAGLLYTIYLFARKGEKATKEI